MSGSELDQRLRKEKDLFLGRIGNAIVGVDDMERVRIVNAFDQVHREEFVPPSLRHLAYSKTSSVLYIGQGQTISEAALIARMIAHLHPSGRHKLLDIGTGSGYQAALLATLAAEGTIYTIERISALAESAKERLHRLGYHNVQVSQGDGSLGLPEQAPFDGIIVAAGAPLGAINVYLNQLNDGGRLVIPIVNESGRGTLYTIVKDKGGCVLAPDIDVSFVALEGEMGWPTGTTKRIMMRRILEVARQTELSPEHLMEIQAAQVEMTVSDCWGFTPEELTVLLAEQ